MIITQRDLAILECLARYFLLDRKRIQALCFASDASGRIARRRLQRLCSAKLIQRLRMEVVNPADGAPAPVYLLAQRGREVLAEEYGDETYLFKSIEAPRPQFIQHALAVADTHILLDQAIALQAEDEEPVRLEAWYNESEVVNAAEPDASKHFRLFTELRSSPRRLVFAPDAAFMLSYRGHQGVFYLEQDRGTSGARQVAARKSPGAAEFARRQLHRRHFPETTLDRFTILCIAPTANRRDALRRAFRGKDGAEMWRFGAGTEVTLRTALFDTVWCQTENHTLVPLVIRRQSSCCPERVA